LIWQEILSDFGGKRMFPEDSGNDLKSGKLSAGMGGRFRPESVAGFNRNGWQVCAGIYSRQPRYRALFGTEKDDMDVEKLWFGSE
jgi:hypothetical protein